MKRQGLTTTVRKLQKLIEDLESEMLEENGVDKDRRFQINIINKTPECSDTWEIET